LGKEFGSRDTADDKGGWAEQFENDSVYDLDPRDPNADSLTALGIPAIPIVALTGGRRRAKPKRRKPGAHRGTRMLPGRKDCVGRKPRAPDFFHVRDIKADHKERAFEEWVSGGAALNRWGCSLSKRTRKIMNTTVYWERGKPERGRMVITSRKHRKLMGGKRGIASYLLSVCGSTRTGRIPMKDSKGRAEARRAIHAVYKGKVERWNRILR